MYKPGDFSRAAELYTQKGFDYALPELGGDRFAFGVVGEENDKVQIIAFLRLVPEAYLLLNEQWGTPEERLEAFVKTHEAVKALSQRRGFEAVYCWIPPELASPLRRRRTFVERLWAAWHAFNEKDREAGERPFIRRLLKLGWIKDRWQSFTFNLR